METERYTASAVTENRYRVGVAVELGNIFLYPPTEKRTLVKKLRAPNNAFVGEAVTPRFRGLRTHRFGTAKLVIKKRSSASEDAV